MFQILGLEVYLSGRNMVIPAGRAFVGVSGRANPSQIPPRVKSAPCNINHLKIRRNMISAGGFEITVSPGRV